MDISKVKLENQVYNIKDETARNQIQNLTAEIQSSNYGILKNFKGKVCYFGDSYSNIETCPVNWCNELSSILGLSSEDIFLSSRWNGSGFIGGGGAPTWRFTNYIYC